jgi:hypothetical protein
VTRAYNEFADKVAGRTITRLSYAADGTHTAVIDGVPLIVV